MIFRSLIIIIICILVLTAGVLVWNESYYCDLVPCLSPIDYAGNLPLRNDSRGSGAFGTRRNGNRRHQGIDILAPIGTPVCAAKGGVAFAGDYQRGMGKYVKIVHRNGVVTIYGHLSAVCIRPIQKVRQGTVIGAVGKTGNAQSKDIQPHLHFEMRRRGVALDPRDYLF